MPLDQTILPVAPTSSIYGLNTSIQDTPREVNQVTPEQFSNTNLKSLDDLLYFGPAQTPYGGGLVNQSPVIRGQGAAIYTNGIVNGAAYQESIPLSTNAYQSADIVSGPATVVFGPTPFTSGYLNYDTKQPFFDSFHGTFTADLGKWDSGGEGGYPDFTQTLDFGAPIINDQLAYRVSLQKQEADSYYLGDTNNFNNVYTALSWLPTKDLTFDWNFDFGTYSYNESSGINRVTQGLLDNNTYQGGQAISLGGGELYVLAPNSPTGKIYGYETLTNPASVYYATDLNTQLKTTYRASDDLSIVNTTAFEHLTNQKEDFIGFYQYNDSYYFENRTEFQLDEKYNVGGLDIEHQSNSGLDLRYEHTDVDWLIADADLQGYDLLSGLPNNTSSIQGAPSTPYTYHGIPALPGSTYETSDLQTGLFTQNNFKFGDQWALNLGARGDLYTVGVYNPLVPGGDSSNYILPSLNSSLSYKPVPWTTTYLTFDYSQAYNGGGGPGWGTLGPQNTLGSANFHSDSLLYEAGAKFEVVPNQVFANIAGFYQEREQYDSISGLTYPLEVHGVDSSIRYQPNKNFNAGINFSWENAHYDNFIPSLGAFNGEGLVANGATPFGNIFVTNMGASRSSYQVPWIPDLNVSAFADYKFDFGLGFNAKLWATSQQNIDYTGDYHVPAQYNLDLGAYYDQPNWRVQVDFLNVTDARVWEPVYGGTVDNALEGEPFGIQGRITYRF